MLVSDKTDFKTKTVTKGKEGYYAMIKKKTVQQEDITLVYAPNLGASKYINQIFTYIKGEIDSDTIIVRGL